MNKPQQVGRGIPVQVSSKEIPGLVGKLTSLAEQIQERIHRIDVILRGECPADVTSGPPTAAGLMGSLRMVQQVMERTVANLDGIDNYI